MFFAVVDVSLCHIAVQWCINCSFFILVLSIFRLNTSMWRTEDIHHTDHRGSRPNRKKYIGDDTKAATRQSLNCIKNKKNK